jgi:hypothetical protein
LDYNQGIPKADQGIATLPPANSMEIVFDKAKRALAWSTAVPSFPPTRP